MMYEKRGPEDAQLELPKLAEFGAAAWAGAAGCAKEAGCAEAAGMR